MVELGINETNSIAFNKKYHDLVSEVIKCKEPKQKNRWKTSSIVISLPGMLLSWLFIVVFFADGGPTLSYQGHGFFALLLGINWLLVYDSCGNYRKYLLTKYAISTTYFLICSFCAVYSLLPELRYVDWSRFDVYLMLIVILSTWGTVIVLHRELKLEILSYPNNVRDFEALRMLADGVFSFHDCSEFQRSNYEFVIVASHCSSFGTRFLPDKLYSQDGVVVTNADRLILRILLQHAHSRELDAIIDWADERLINDPLVGKYLLDNVATRDFKDWRKDEYIKAVWKVESE